MLSVRLYQPGKVTDELCRKLWRLRLANIGLRPEVDPEDDYREFARYFQNGTTAVTFWAQGELQGIFGWNDIKTRVDGHEFVRIIPEYVFMNPGYRGRPELLLAGLRLATPRLFRDIGVPKVAVGVAYPGTYIAARLNARDVMTLHSPELTPPERKLLEEFLGEYYGGGFDPSTGLVRMRTLPHVPSRESTRPDVRTAFAEYEAMNPRWRDGYGVPTLFRLSWTGARQALLGAMKRALT